MEERNLIVIVPGRNDRAFYKSFFRAAAQLLKLTCHRDIYFEDLDRSDRSEEKKNVVFATIGPLMEAGVGKWSVVSIFSGNTRLNIVIGLGESRGQNPVAVLAARLSALLMGRDERNVDAIIVVDDAEDAGFKERLDSLTGSFLSALNELVDYELVERKDGKYFVVLLVRAGGGAALPVMFVVQGLEPRVIGELPVELLEAGKRALEDFIVFAAREYLHAMPRQCLLQLLGKGSRLVHKKLTYLLMVYFCEVSPERFIYRVVGEEVVSELLGYHDGLRMMIEVLGRVLGCRDDGMGSSVRTAGPATSA